MRSYSSRGYELTKRFEGCRLTPYRDGGGVLTNGWGNTHNVMVNVKITQDQADADLVNNIQEAVDCVNDNVIWDINQNQFDACVDLVYNIGCGAFIRSTLLKLLNKGLEDEAANQFLRWNKDNGVVVGGLTNRRMAERDLFKEPTDD